MTLYISHDSSFYSFTAYKHVLCLLLFTFYWKIWQLSLSWTGKITSGLQFPKSVQFPLFWQLFQQEWECTDEILHIYTQPAQISHVAGTQPGQEVPSWTHALMPHVSKLPVCLFAALRVRELPCQHGPHTGSNCYKQTEKKNFSNVYPITWKRTISLAYIR